MTEKTGNKVARHNGGRLWWWYVCWLHRGSNCPVVQEMDVHTMSCGIISSCQSAATSEIATCFLTWADSSKQCYITYWIFTLCHGINSSLSMTCSLTLLAKYSVILVLLTRLPTKWGLAPKWRHATRKQQGLKRFECRESARDAIRWQLSPTTLPTKAETATNPTPESMTRQS